MGSWSWDDVQRSNARTAKPKIGGVSVKIAITLDADRAERLQSIAVAADCSRTEIARRLLAAVIDDDAAAHGEIE